ncbi:MAG: glycosyltransferase family 2 protein [Candidatus Bathyarchaeia archaeon]
MKVSVIIPTYNEADNISRLIADLIRHLENNFKDFEIIVVDDNSPDETWRIVEEESKKDCRVRLIRRINIRGLGSAIVDGLRDSMGDYIIVMDADFQHPPNIVPQLVYKAIETGADIVVASRYAKGGKTEGWSMTRKIISLGALLLAHLLICESRRTKDPISGFFLVKKGLNFSALRGKGCKALLEILVANPRAKVIDLPYTFTRRASGKSKLKFMGIIDYIVQILWLSKFSRFAIVGASGVLVNLGAMALTFKLGAPVDLASISGIETSILWNYVWHEIWTFKYWFKGGLKSILLRYTYYHLSVLVGAFTQYIVMKILYILFFMNPLLAQLAGIVVGLITNYIVSKLIVWPEY